MKKLLITCCVILFVSSAYAQNNTGKFKIVREKKKGSFDVQRFNKAQFKKNISLVRILPNMTDDEKQKLADKIPINRNGIKAKKRTYIPENELILSTFRKDIFIRINLIKSQKKGTAIFISSYDKNGEIILINQNDIGLFDLLGKEVNLNIDSFEGYGGEAYFSLLIDRSGSMEDFMPKVLEETKNFLRLLPSNSICNIIAFNNSYYYILKDSLCESGIERLIYLQASGKTDFYTPLKMIYSRHNKLGNEQNAVLIVSDGIGTALNTPKQDVLSVKNGTPTFIYWLGEYDRAELMEFGDFHIFGRQDAETLIKKFYKKIGDSISKQQVIIVK